MKSGFVSIVGKTNVGKSSIINSLVGEKVAAIANRPQTTRKAIKAIVNRPDSQMLRVLLEMLFKVFIMMKKHKLYL